MPLDYYPKPSFYFSVDCGMGEETSFQEVSGITYTIETEPVCEGGDNIYPYHLLKSIKYENLKLIRGFMSKDSKLFQWCVSLLNYNNNTVIEPKLITVKLLDETGAPVTTWTFDNAYPVKWSVSSFNSMKNEYAVETIEFKFKSMNMG